MRAYTSAAEHRKRNCLHSINRRSLCIRVWRGRYNTVRNRGRRKSRRRRGLSLHFHGMSLLNVLPGKFLIVLQDDSQVAGLWVPVLLHG
jgi:hypothetical protein